MFGKKRLPVIILTARKHGVHVTTRIKKHFVKQQFFTILTRWLGCNITNENITIDN
ncbi:hypothetical protein HanXRQr2_Chr06g0246991 [Helianthus annuus]|uniref:Uncharacterized protein n=1 Tax=Helianthus annuus TaxID=4232 RepID=A0A9K3IS40_HELAN|nr:hypothetical protein HanXRQr2_Chr06g0246991 [Helianthus annuus]